MGGGKNGRTSGTGQEMNSQPRKRFLQTSMFISPFSLPKNPGNFSSFLFFLVAFSLCGQQQHLKSPPKHSQHLLQNPKNLDSHPKKICFVHSYSLLLLQRRPLFPICHPELHDGRRLFFFFFFLLVSLPLISRADFCHRPRGFNLPPLPTRLRILHLKFSTRSMFLATVRGRCLTSPKRRHRSSRSRSVSSRWPSDSTLT